MPRAARLIGEREAAVDEGGDRREEVEGGGGWRMAMRVRNGMV